ncbi:phage protein [Streptococcus pyogenes JRS4]|nr:phage protein [Streptococcus pyogenes]BAR45062.1 phage protein [Streptococcus pyogenes JRS4]SQF08827.1 phage protein [Streptococcus pyogenes]SQF37969.1 phage protein [Streptococcus pyogenes]SQF38373.1 phage protein [Streptococcus pyogenes]
MNISLKFIDETLAGLNDILRQGGLSCSQSQALVDAVFILIALKQVIEERK